MRTPLLCFTCLTTAIIPSSPLLLAQTAPLLEPGARIRLNAPAVLTPARQTGTLVERRGETLVVRLDGAASPIVLFPNQISEWEVSRGRQPSVGAGMVAGFLGDGVMGALIGVATYEKPTCASGSGCFAIMDFGPTGTAAASALVGGLAGTVIGGMIGAKHGSERWERASPPWVSRIGIAPAHDGGVAFSLALRL